MQKMDKRHDLELILQSRTPIVVIESQDEARMLEMLQLRAGDY